MIERSFWEENYKIRLKIENNRDLDEDTLEKDILNFLKLIHNSTNRETQNKYSRRISIARKLKKIPYCIFKTLSTMYRYKNTKINLVTESYCMVFVLGFLPYFGLHPDVSKFDLFLDFIVLFFPESKVKTTLNELLETKSLSRERFDNLSVQLTIRTHASKASFHKLYLCNSSFKLIIAKVLENLSRMN